MESTTGKVRDLNTSNVDVEPYWRPPDGRQLMYLEGIGDRKRLFLVDVEATDEEALPVSAPENNLRPGGWTPTGSRFVVHHFEGEDGPWTSLFDPETGADERLDLAFGRVSNDGTRIVGYRNFRDDPVLCVMTLPDGACDEIAEGDVLPRLGAHSRPPVVARRSMDRRVPAGQRHGLGSPQPRGRTADHAGLVEAGRGIVAAPQALTHRRAIHQRPRSVSADRENTHGLTPAPEVPRGLSDPLRRRAHTGRRSMPEGSNEGDSMSDQSLYDRLGGAFAIAAVVDQFSNALVKNPVVGQGSANPALNEWHTNDLDRLPGLKFMRTLWVCNVAGGPFEFTATRPGRTVLGLEEAHRDLHISPEQFDEVAAELARPWTHSKIPEREKGEVLAAFGAHKGEVTEGYRAPVGGG